MITKNFMQNGPSKTFQNKGKWVERTTKAAVLLCSCGNKYIQTRGDKQTTCVKCMYKK
ncbi:MAG: hypothetical protein WC835_03140 [Candidatus Paceibacterota bacterium]